jgi:hypothetical protein
MQIILNEWAGYDLYREKIIGDHAVQCGLGRLLAKMAEFPAGLDVEVTLIVNTDIGEKQWFLKRLFIKDKDLPYAQRYYDLKEKYPFIKHLVFRSNWGRDIGAYNCGYWYLRKKNYQGDVLFLNTGVGGPKDSGWLLKYRDQFYKGANIGLCGITINSHDTNLDPSPFMPHVQSFFLFTNMTVLKRVFPFNLCGVWVLHDKKQLIQEGEIGISQKILNKGYGICCIALRDFNYYQGHDWSIPYAGDLRFLKEFHAFANQI